MRNGQTQEQKARAISRVASFSIPCIYPYVTARPGRQIIKHQGAELLEIAQQKVKATVINQDLISGSPA